MAVVTRKTKIKRKLEKSYVPHLLRSRPFYFIGFPWIVLLVSMFYWLVLCPLLFAHLLYFFEDDSRWPIYFWVTVFLFYLVMLSMFVCCWRCSSKKTKEETLYVTTIDNCDDSSIELQDIPKTAEEKQENGLCGKSEPSPVIDQDQLFPRCSVRQKKRPDSLVFDETRPVSQNLSSPLTPRELFFLDLIEGANKTCSSTTYNFLQNEKKNYTPDEPSVHLSDDQCHSPSEFFIANVPVDKSCTSEVFLYVDSDKDKATIQVVCDEKGVRL